MRLTTRLVNPILGDLHEFQGHTALLWCARMGLETAVEKLLQHGANVNQTNNFVIFGV
jgi:ankyrin repeat protein